jgi:DUF1707 SHOCT-like domain
MAGPGDEMAAAAGGRGRLRASHADREQVIGTLKAAFVQGRLTKDELDARVGQTFAARTYADLAAPTADLPAGLAATRPLRKPVRGPMNNAAKAGIWVVIAVAVPVVLLSPTGGAAFLLLTPFYFMALAVLGAEILVSWREKRSHRRQLPPGPAQRGQALEGEQDGTIGDDLMLSEARNDARDRHVPGHRVIQRTWWSLTARRDERRPAGLQVTA